MISMAGIGGAGAAASYYTKDNYYTDRDASEASAWAGAGAERAGLSGEVGVDAFKAILEGTMPDGTVIPTGRNGTHAPGMDLTFSAPKSLSLLAYIGGDERLLAANLAAVKETMAWAEKNLAETRISKDGKVTTQKTGNLVAALFQHDTNRNLDPQAHVHAVIANATQDKDGKWRALHNGKLWENNTLLGSIYHAALRAKVEALGYTTELQGKYGTFEIAGISRAAIETFSTRRVKILATAEAKLDHMSPQGLRAVTVRTRDAKTAIEDRGDLRAEWQARAKAIGLDLNPLVEHAHSASSERPAPTRWEQLTAGIDTTAKRLSSVVDYVRDKLGHAPREFDPYMPHNAHRLDDADLGAATAVASAIRHLSERETSFDTFAVYKAALDLGLPVQIDGVERAVTALRREVKLIAGTGERAGELTTPAALATEHRILAGATRDQGTLRPIVAKPAEAGRRVLEATQTREGFTLNEGQEGAARLILASPDRVVSVQGVAGSGKSSVLGAVAIVARKEGYKVLALGPQNELVNRLAASSGIDAATVAKFVTRHKPLLNQRTFVERLDFARAMFKDSLVVVDEASMVSNSQMLTLVELANKLDFKLALVKDDRQLGAVEAGKPAEVMQAAGLPTAIMTENLRSKTPQLLEAAALANEGRTGDAFRRLRSTVTEAPGRMVEEAVARWIGKPDEERAQTLLLASGRKVREGLNLGVQDELLKEGTIGGRSATLTVLDNANLTREQERYAAEYKVGQTITFARDLKAQNIAKGTGTIAAVDVAHGQVTIERADGTVNTLIPGRLAVNRAENSLTLGTAKDLTVYEGDKIRWTANDPARGLFNSGKATILAISHEGLKIQTATGIELTLPHGDKQLARVDLGYAMNAHGNQGIGESKGIGVIDSRETNLASAKLFLVQITRVKDAIELIVNNADRVAGAITRNSGEKTAGLETTDEISTNRTAPPTPAPGNAPSNAVSNARAGRNTPATAPEPDRNIGPPVPVRELTRDRQPDFGL